MAQDPPSQYVTLISYDHFEFVIPRETAKRAGAIKRMIDPDSMYTSPLLGWQRSFGYRQVRGGNDRTMHL